MTAYKLMERVINNNSPIDWDWLSYLRRTASKKELIDWCRENVAIEAPQGTSKWTIGRAANMLYYRLF